MCADACPSGAIGRNGGAVCIDRTHCAVCAVFSCQAACPAKALEAKGREMTSEAILDAVEREEIFYHHGDGGLTLSGGEPLMQGDALIDLLYKAKRRRLNTVMETCGFGDYVLLREAARYLDALFFDIKSIDDTKHLEWTGVSNKSILENFKALRSDFPGLQITVRTPVVPGFNNTPEELDRIHRVAGQFHEQLPLHRWGEWKYEALGRTR
jgi:pyruvate formate lyase activating enzyme